MLLAVLGCRQLVTLAGPARPRVGPEMSELAIIPDGAMIVREGVIERCGSQAEIEPLITGAYEVVDAGGRIVMPGFVDAHTHLVFAGNRANELEMRAGGASYEEIASAGGGIMSTVRATRAATVDDLFAQSCRHAEWMLRAGTTTAEAKSGYGLSLDAELKILQVIRRIDEETPMSLLPTFLGAHAVPPEMSKPEYVELVIRDMLPACAPRAEFCDVFVEQGYFDSDDARRVILRATGLGMGIRMHVDQLTNGGGAVLAAELNANTADHLEQTDLAGIRAMKDGGVQPVLLPASVQGLGKTKYPDARTMIDEGLAVVLATDFNPGSSPTPTMLTVLCLARTQMKMSAAEAITASTVNAAYSLNRGHDRGSLEPGKRADFVIWDCEDVREIGYWTGVELAQAVYCQGKRS